jgi:hypothetical protein
MTTTNEWQPIETAPKDGNDILLCHAGGDSMVVAFWDEDGTKLARWQTADGVAYHEDWPGHWVALPPAPGRQ